MKINHEDALKSVDIGSCPVVLEMTGVIRLSDLAWFGCGAATHGTENELRWAKSYPCTS